MKIIVEIDEISETPLKILALISKKSIESYLTERINTHARKFNEILNTNPDVLTFFL